MIYLIDHEDSFTYNLAHILENFDEVYVSNYFKVNDTKLNKASLVVFSPGPGEPKDYPRSNQLYKKLKGKCSTFLKTNLFNIYFFRIYFKQ